jgi:hypothetical protein
LYEDANRCDAVAFAVEQFVTEMDVRALRQVVTDYRAMAKRLRAEEAARRAA